MSSGQVGPIKAFVEQLLIDNGYKTRYFQSEHLYSGMSTFDKNYSKDVSVLSRTIYCEPKTWDFLVYNKSMQKKYMVIETVWLTKNTTHTDEIFPYIVQNIKAVKTPTIIVIDGDGYSTEALKWLKGQICENMYGLIGVYNMNEFEKLVKETF